MKNKRVWLIVSIIAGIIILGIAAYCITSVMHDGTSMQGQFNNHAENMMHGGRGDDNWHHPGNEFGRGGFGIGHFVMKILQIAIAFALVFGIYTFFTRRYQIVRKPAPDSESTSEKELDNNQSK